MRVPADINQAAALKRHCQLNCTKKEEKPFFAEDLLLFCCFPEIFPEPSRHHLQFISIFCSCERLLHFLCALFCGTILFVRGFQSLTLCAPPTQTQQSHSVRQEYYIATWKWLIFMVSCNCCYYSLSHLCLGNNYSPSFGMTVWVCRL